MPPTHRKLPVAPEAENISSTDFAADLPVIQRDKSDTIAAALIKQKPGLQGALWNMLFQKLISLAI